MICQIVTSDMEKIKSAKGMGISRSRKWRLQKKNFFNLTKND